MAQIDELIRGVRKVRPDFAVLSGNDDQAFHLVCSGGDGLISVLSNVMPKETSDMVRLSLDGRMKEARDAEDRVAADDAIYDLIDQDIAYKDGGE